MIGFIIFKLNQKKIIMKNLQKILLSFFLLLVFCNNTFAFFGKDSTANNSNNPMAGAFDNPAIMGGIIGALVAILIMRYRSAKKKN